MVDESDLKSLIVVKERKNWIWWTSIKIRKIFKWFYFGIIRPCVFDSKDDESVYTFSEFIWMEDQSFK